MVESDLTITTVRRYVQWDTCQHIWCDYLRVLPVHTCINLALPVMSTWRNCALCCHFMLEYDAIITSVHRYICPVGQILAYGACLPVGVVTCAYRYHNGSTCDEHLEMVHWSVNSW